MNKNNLIKFSALGFIFSNIGAAVGLGNIWRFPQEVVKNGGGTFIFAYFIVLFAIAFPVILIEMNYGLFFRRGSVGSFEKSNRLFGRFVGWKQTLLTSFLCIYYFAIMSWIFISFIISFVPSLFNQWSSDPNWFDNNILLSKNGANDVSFESIENFRFAPYVFGSFIFVLLIVVVILFLGVKNGLEKANYLFVPGFFIMIFGLTFYALTLQNGKAGQLGVKVLFSFKPENLQQFQIWFNASKQAIFSTGIMFGTIIVFAKSSDIKMDKGNEALIIVLADTLIALVAGIFISSLVASKIYDDNLEGIQGQSFENQVNIVRTQFSGANPNLKGPGLLFAFLPGLFSSINGSASFGWGNILMIVFTLTLLFAALSSIIGLAEVLIDGLSENLLIKRKWAVSFAFLFIFLFSFFYSTSFGTELVDRQDSIILFWIIVLGFLEVAFFVFNSQYQKICEQYDQNSYLKMRFLNWHWILSVFITLPALFILFVFGFLETFGIGAIIKEAGYFENFFSTSKKFVLDIPQKISFVMYGGLITLTFLFTFLTNKIEKKDQNNLLL